MYRDPLGLCIDGVCNPAAELDEILKDIADIHRRLDSLEATGTAVLPEDLEGELVIGGVSGCAFDSSFNYSVDPNDSPCVQQCTDAHELTHGRQCKAHGPFRFAELSEYEKERPAYMNDLGCLLKTLRDAGLYPVPDWPAMTPQRPWCGAGLFVMACLAVAAGACRRVEETTKSPESSAPAPRIGSSVLPTVPSPEPTTTATARTDGCEADSCRPLPVIDSFPRDVDRSRLSLSVLVVISVSAEGEIRGLQFRKSSGSAQVDRKIRETLLSWRFKRQDFGKDVAVALTLEPGRRRRETRK